MKVASHNTITNRIRNFLIARPKEMAFLRSEFNGFAPRRTGVDKALRVLVEEGVLVRGRWRTSRSSGVSTVVPAVSGTRIHEIVHQKLLAYSRAKVRKPRHSRRVGISSVRGTTRVSGARHQGR